MEYVPESLEGPESVEPSPPDRTMPGTGDLLLARFAILGVAGYACAVSMSAPRSITFSDCGLGRDEPFLDLYRRVPGAFVLLIAASWAAGRYLPPVARLARCAAVVSTVIWGVSVGLAWGWW